MNKDYEKCIHRECSKCNDACSTLLLDDCVCNYCLEGNCPNCGNISKCYYEESEE